MPNGRTGKIFRGHRKVIFLMGGGEVREEILFYNDFDVYYCWLQSRN